MAYTAKPSTVPTFATSTGSNILTGLTATAAAWQSNTTVGTTTYGIIRYTFSGSPDLSTVIAGHKLNVTTGFTNAENKVTGAEITAVNNASDWIEVKSPERLDATLDESGVSATSTTVTDAGARILAPSTAKRGLGWLFPEKPSDGIFNWLAYYAGQWLAMLDANYPTGYKLGPELTAGTGISLTDNGDNTKLIAVTLTTASAVQNTFTETAHGFAVKDAVRHNGTAWVKAKADTIATATGAWVVTAVPTANTFTAVRSGRATVTGHGLTAGTTYFLSADTAGLLTSTRPVGNTTRPLGHFTRLVKAIDANTLEMLGGDPQFNPLYAEFISSANSGELISTKSFAAFDLANVGNRMRVAVSCRNEHVSGGAAQVKMKFGNISSATDYTWVIQATNPASADAWVATRDTSDPAWCIGLHHATGDDVPMVMSGAFQRALNDATNTSPAADVWFYTGECISYDAGDPPSRGVVGGQTKGSATITSVSFASSNANAEMMTGDYIRFYIDRMPDA